MTEPLGSAVAMPERAKPGRGSGVGIVCCTYNGGLYLADQLRSFLEQTAAPAVVIIADDCSTDSSVEIAEQFANRAPFAVHVVRNDRRLGIVRNFESAAALCSAEIVAYSDQDDVWFPDRIETIERAFSDPSVTAFVSNAKLMTEDGTITDRTLWERIHISPRHRRRIERDPFPAVCQRNPGFGFTLAFRQSLLPALIPFGEINHDLWTLQVAAAHGRVVLCERPLAAYRQHRDQIRPYRAFQRQRRPSTADSRVTWKEDVANYAALEQRLAATAPAAAARARQAGDHFRVRSVLPDRRRSRLPAIMSEVVRGRYWRYSHGTRSVMRDLFFTPDLHQGDRQ